MQKTIRRVWHTKAKVPRLKRVAAYARVSSGKDAMLHSLSAQVSHYSSFIQQHRGWQYAGVYVDEALTGTKDNRQGFVRLLAACRAGEVDLVLTKSVSRFARNTITLLETVRELKALGVDVYFEEQNIHSLSADGELMLSILASYAQEESLSVSENQKWRIRKNFTEGKPWNGTMLGYRYQEGQLVVVSQEAALVRRIFQLYLEGKGMTAIMKELNASELPTRFGNTWCRHGVMRVLRNYAYTGNLLLQQTYTDNHLSKRRMKNTGELPRYHAQGSHEAIIPLERYQAVQEEMKNRAARFAHTGKKQQAYPFTGLIQCATCHKQYNRKSRPTGPVWICSTYNTLGRDACPSKQIPETTLIATACEVLGCDSLDAHSLRSRLTSILAQDNNTLVFTFKDGSQVVKRWADRSRANSWTPEMREAVSQANHERRQNT